MFLFLLEFLLRKNRCCGKGWRWLAEPTFNCLWIKL